MTYFCDGRGVGRGQRKVGLHGLRPCDKEAHRLNLAHAARAAADVRGPAAETARAGYSCSPEMCSGVRLVTSTFAPGPGRGDSETIGAASMTALEIVQHRQQPLSPQAPAPGAPAAALPPLARRTPRRWRKGDQGRIVERAQIDEPDTIGKTSSRSAGDLEGDPGLTDATWAGDREEPNVIAAGGRQPAPPGPRGPRNGVGCKRKVVGTRGQRAQRREVGRESGWRS